MPSTASQLERSLRKLQISDSQETSTTVQWVPSTYSSDESQYVLEELWNMGIIAFKKFKPNEALPDLSFFAMNSLSYLMVYLNLRICTLAYGKVVGDSKNLPLECASSRDVLLLVLWRDTESEADCPTPRQVQSLEIKLKRSPGWWVEIPPFRYE
ncbi:hypothetical protein CY34DRAFT_471841 [Suillus luteus UH-Slu-Lm8-n1]|uniref:Uncharacterized protein n=1 Tax=Suillus luteus UH-Slu-Lm8-n1 TaxID=930992 RepID=A0A0D0BIZ8_9AGAM|nr:hypothetical protein CY34DRAFT_471841 [Suillus luteus UH-Slu-Lm8-n1]